MGMTLIGGRARPVCTGTRRVVGLAVVLPLVSAMLGACEQPGATPSAKGPAAPAPVAVVVSQPVPANVVEWDEYTARFDAVQSVDVRARISGYLNEIAFKDGQVVKKGDLLFVIDPRPYERALEQAQAELGQARTKVENASLDVERGKPLLERRVMSEKTFDDRANLMREAQAAVKVSEAKVASAELDLAFTRMTSPIEGRIGRALVTPGNWVSAGTVANATLLTTIVSQDPIYVYFDVSENNYLKYKRLAERGEGAGPANAGAPIEIAMPDDKGYPHKGRLDFIDNRLDPGTATMRARAIVDNKSEFFSPGMFARVRIRGSAEYPALLIPDAAIGTDQTSKFVQLVGSDGVVSRRSVAIGPLHGGLRIVREGLRPDEWVIVRGARARPGQKADPKREPIATATAEAAKLAAGSPVRGN